MIMIKHLLLTGILFASGVAAATPPIASLSDYKGFVKLSEEKEFYVNYIKAKEGQPTVILMNGLTYSTRQWDTMVAALLQYGVGVVRFDFDGMGETLLRYAPALHPFQIEDQAKNLKLMLTSMGLEGPYNFAGLSYGGGALAKYTELYPDDVGQMIMMAPFTEPLAEQDELILKNVQWNKIMFPYNPASDDELYDYFLRQLIYATYPAVEPVILENPFKLEAAFRLVQGIRKFKAIEVTEKIPARKLHLMIALRDQYIKQNVLDKYWDATPEASRASRIYIRDSDHKIPESVPAFAAYWVYRIISKDEALFGGGSFIGNPHDNTAQIIK